MNTFLIVDVSSSLVNNPKQRHHISREDVDLNLLKIRIFKNRHGRSKNTYHIYKGDKVIFTGKINDIKTVVSSRRVQYGLYGGKLAGYQILISADIAVTA